MTSELPHLLLTLTLASSGAIVLAVGLRHPVRRLLGAPVSCSLWLLVPASMAAVLLPHAPTVDTAPSGPLLTALTMPAVESVLHGSPVAASVTNPGAWPAAVMSSWVAGAALLFCYFLSQQRAFVRSLGIQSGARRVLRAQAPTGCPAVMGLLRPKLILPADFRLRYTPLERRLILAHERAHLYRGDLTWNGLATLLRCLFWFNPLAHLAAACLRADRELACDAAVMLRHPGLRRTYAAAMLKTQLGASTALVCSWNSASQLKERLRMLGHALPGPARRAWGRPCLTLIFLAAAYTAWATQPAAPDSVTPQTLTGVAPSERTASWCEQWHPTRVFRGSNAVLYAKDVNSDGTLAKVLVARSRGPVLDLLVAPSARHGVSTDGTMHIFTLYDGARYEGVPEGAGLRMIPYFDALSKPIQVPPQAGAVQDLDARSSNEMHGVIDKVTRAERQWNLTIPCP